MKRISRIALLFLLLVTASAGRAGNTDNSSLITIEGTPLARLQSIMDVLQQIPGITFSIDAGLQVVGYGEPLIYFGERKLTEGSELWQTPAWKVLSIEVLRSPGAKYGKDVQVVIVITLKEEPNDGFHLNEYFYTTINRKVSANEELSLSYKNNKVTIGGFLAFNNTRGDTYKENYVESYHLVGSQTYLPQSGTKTISRTEADDKTLTAKADISYNLTPKHSIQAGFAVYRTFDQSSRQYDRIRYKYGVNKQGDAVDFTTPTAIDTLGEASGIADQTRREMHIDYHGSHGIWHMNAGYNSFMRKATDNDDGDYYGRTEGYDRIYGDATADVWKGGITFGIEYTHNTLEFLSTSGDQLRNNINAYSTNRMVAGFADISQKFGIVELGAGLRYEHGRFAYNTLPMDASIVDFGREPIWMSRTQSNFFPNAKVALHLRDHTLTAAFSSSRLGVNLEDIKIKFLIGGKVDNYYLPGEKIKTTSLTWQWKWIAAHAAHKYFTEPVYTSATTDPYKGKDFHSIDVGFVLSPVFSSHKGNSTRTMTDYSYSPTLNVHVTKQWLEVDLPNGESSLGEPVVYASFNNIVTFPHDWIVRLNTNWTSDGYDRNIHLYSSNFVMDASLQKDFLHRRLSLSLEAQNLLHTSKRDITIYNIRALRTSNGSCLTHPTSVTLSLRYRL